MNNQNWHCSWKSSEKIRLKRYGKVKGRRSLEEAEYGRTAWGFSVGLLSK